MKPSLFIFFNRTFGVLVRWIQLSLIRRGPIQGVHYLVDKKAVEDSARYVLANQAEFMLFANREDLWTYCLSKSSGLQKEDALITEFGVWKGESLNFFAKKYRHAAVHGFDSFEGLEEDWVGTSLPKGTFDTGGKLPRCQKNVSLHVGWFEKTLPSFLSQIGTSQISFLHMDADTYKPTKYVLDSLANNLKSGSIIVFDEYFGYSGWEMHEFKAFHEWVDGRSIEYKYLGCTEMAVGLEIL